MGCATGSVALDSERRYFQNCDKTRVKPVRKYFDMLFFFFFFFLLALQGLELRNSQELALVGKALYHLIHALSPFLL
jgi:hypothetical protein